MYKYFLLRLPIFLMLLHCRLKIGCVTGGNHRSAHFVLTRNASSIPHLSQGILLGQVAGKTVLMDTRNSLRRYILCQILARVADIGLKMSVMRRHVQAADAGVAKIPRLSTSIPFPASSRPAFSSRKKRYRDRPARCSLEAGYAWST